MRDKKGRFIKGNHVRTEFKKGSSGFIGKHTKESREKMRLTHLANPNKYWLGKKRPEITGNNSKRWKGDDVGYYALHTWVIRNLGKPLFCEDCGTKKSKKFEWANVDHQYKRNLMDWIRLCKKCHVGFDDSINKGWETRRQI